MKLYLQGLVVAIIAIVILDSCGVNTNRATVGNKGTLCNVVHNNTRYGCVTSKTGRIWLDRNLGAIKVAKTPFYSLSYGDYFQWGRPADGHQRSASSTVGSAQASTTSPSNSAFITVDANTADWVDDGVDDNGTLREVFLWKTNGMGICPQGYRVPTAAEWRAELNASSQDMSNSALKLPLAGFRDGKTGKVNKAKSPKNDPNAVGYYLASDSSSQKLVKFLFLDQNRRGKIDTKGRAYGYSVRCIKALKGETPPVISGGSGKTPSSGSGNAPSDDRDNSMATATPIGPNGTTQGRIDRAGDRDWFKIVIPSTGTLVVKTTGETDTIGSLYDVSGRRQIAYDDDSGTGRNFKMTQTVTAGTYYVEVEHRSISETGSYVFVSQFIADDHSNTKGEATAINLNTTTPGNIEVAGDKDWFKIVIPSTGTLVVNTTGATDTKGALLSENGVQVASDDNSGASDNFKITKAITVVGTYYIKIKHHSPTGTGNYSLATMFTPGRVEQAKSLDDYGDTNATARTISPTSTTSGSLEVAGDVDYFKIVIPSTGTLVVKTAGFTDTNGSLLDASNTPIATDHNSGSERNFEISTFIQHAGTYYVMVKHLSPEATGNYVLVSEFTPDDHGSVRSLATVISPNSVTAGNIGSAGDEDWFKIVLPNDGRTLTVSTTGTADTNGSLYNASGGEPVSDDDSGSDRNFKISERNVTAGTYYVRVKHHNASLTGSYSLVVHFDDHSNTKDEATSITPNTVATTVSGDIETAGDVDYFKINITSAGTLTMGISSQTTDDINISFSDDNTIIALGDSSNTLGISQSVKAGKTYYIKVTHHNATGTGRYDLATKFTPSTPSAKSESALDPASANANSPASGTDTSDTNTSDTNTSDTNTPSTDTSGTPASGTPASGTNTSDTNTSGTPASGTNTSDTNTSDTNTSDTNTSGTPASDTNTSDTNTSDTNTSGTPASGTNASAVPPNDNNDTSDGATPSSTPPEVAPDDHNNTRNGATPIDLNDTISGSIETAGDEDWFKIVIPSGSTGTLVVETTGSTDTNGVLYNVDDTEIVTDDNNGSDNNFRIEHNVTAGTYYVKVSASSTGSYELVSKFTPPEDDT